VHCVGFVLLRGARPGVWQGNGLRKGRSAVFRWRFGAGGGRSWCSCRAAVCVRWPVCVDLEGHGGGKASRRKTGVIYLGRNPEQAEGGKKARFLRGQGNSRNFFSRRSVPEPAVLGWCWMKRTSDYAVGALDCRQSGGGLIASGKNLGMLSAGTRLFKKCMDWRGFAGLRIVLPSDGHGSLLSGD